MPPQTERWSEQEKDLVLPVRNLRRFLHQSAEGSIIPNPGGGFVIPRKVVRDGIEGIGMCGHSDLHQEPSKCFGSHQSVFTRPREVESIGLVHDDGTIARYGDLQAKHSGYEMTGDKRPHAGRSGRRKLHAIPDGFHFEVPQDHEIDFELRFRPSGIDKPFKLDAELVPDQKTSRALHLIPLSIRSWRVGRMRDTRTAMDQSN